MTAIFISHAVADKKLAKLFTDFLKEAIGIPHDEIFCSSIEGHGVPMTEDFNKYMKDEIQEPDLGPVDKVWQPYLCGGQGKEC